MSQQLPNLPWIHIGECPFCVNGLCRVRYCDCQREPHLFALCDECEAIWVEPTTDSPKQFPDAEHPQCPVCSGPLYGPHTRWAEPQDLVQTPWEDAAIFDVPSTEPVIEDFLTLDDLTGELDVPAIPEGGFPTYAVAPEPPMTVVDRFPEPAIDGEYLPTPEPDHGGSTAHRKSQD